MAQHNPFRFGICGLSTESRYEWQEYARKVESLGFSILYLPDHFTRFFDPFAGLVSAADATTNLRVGTFVIANDFRNPVVLAKQVATVDVLSDGRFELGIGAGWNELDYTKSGIPFERAGVRVGRLEESLKIMKAYFAGDPITFSGEYYTVDGLEGFPKPAKIRILPLWWVAAVNECCLLQDGKRTS